MIRKLINKGKIRWLKKDHPTKTAPPEVGLRCSLTPGLSPCLLRLVSAHKATTCDEPLSDFAHSFDLRQ